jgi:hypothetical protein
MPIIGQDNRKKLNKRGQRAHKETIFAFQLWIKANKTGSPHL